MSARRRRGRRTPRGRFDHLRERARRRRVGCGPRLFVAVVALLVALALVAGVFATWGAR